MSEGQVMSGKNFEGANLKQQALMFPSVHPKSGRAASVSTTWQQVSDPTTDELKGRVSALYETHIGRIHRFLVSKGLNPTIAQEVTQDVFVDLFLALKKGIRIESEQRWLYAVAGRAVVDHWRRNCHETRVDFDSEPNAAANVPSSEPTPEAQAERRERLTRVTAGLRNLPNELRLCIHLRAQGLHYREIAKALEVSTSTAAEWLVSAISSLREQANGRSSLTRTVTPQLGRRAI
jgi:RNA polymerase sigma-70 factor, ECF subfamily